MSILRPAKLYFSDLPKLETHNENHWKNNLKLSKIDEVSENQSERLNEYNLSKAPTLQADLQNTLILSPRSQFFLQFLQRLVKHPKVFTQFIAKAFDKKQKFSEKNNRFKIRLNKSVKVVKKILDSDYESDSDESYISNETLKKKYTSYRKGLIYTDHWKYEKKKLEIPQTASSSGSSVRKTGLINNLKSFKKRMILNQNNPELLKIFKKISLEKQKISSEDFRNYLASRYPALVADTISKVFTFKYLTYEEYVNEMNRFVNMGEERHLNFCFEIFDFNKDKKINYQDTFKAMEIRTGNHYDEDLVLILEMFDIKNSGRLKNKQGRMIRRRSTFSLIKEEQKNRNEEEIEKKAEKNKIHSNTSINYTEFCMIKFNVRPQILLDFLKFCCSYDYLLEKGYVQLPPSHRGKDSENIVVDMNLNPEYAEALMKNDKFDYYCALDSAMLLFNKYELDDLLKKFKFLQSDEKLRLKVITKESMIEKLPKMLGYNHPYLSERFYECLSQGKDLTKATFLSKVHAILKNTNQLSVNRLAFDLIDSRSDNKLSVDEVYNISEALPPRSKVYQEISMYPLHSIINMYIQSIFERVREKLSFIDFYRYLELTSESLLGLEFFVMLQTPLEKCINRKTLYFEVIESIPDDFDSKKLTRSSLESMLA